MRLTATPFQERNTIQRQSKQSKISLGQDVSCYPAGGHKAIRNTEDPRYNDNFCCQRFSVKSNLQGPV